MGLDEVMQWIGLISGESCKKKLENHLDYLIRSRQLKGLKNGGKVVACQATTTKRTQINTEQQLRWHELIEFQRKELFRLNKPSKEYKPLQSFFWW